MSSTALQSIRRWTTVMTLSGCVVSTRSESVSMTEQTRDPPRPVPVYLGDSIAFETSDGRLVEAVDRAIGIWRGCPQFGLGFPRLVLPRETTPPGPVIACPARRRG
jgi:hypothetical protein